MVVRCSLLCLALLVGCKGAEGPAGEVGPEGPAGMDGAPGVDGDNGVDGMNGADALAFEVSGSVEGPLAPVGEGVPVFLVAIDDGGQTIGTFGGTFTDASGDFSISVDDGIYPASHLVVQTEVVGTPQSAVVTDAVGVMVDPVSTGVLEAMVLITETPGGRTLADFDTTELDDVYTQAHALLTGGSTDLANPDAVLSDVLQGVGGLLADYSGGTYASSTFTVPAPMDAISSPSFQQILTSSSGAVFDIQPDGELDDGRAPSGQPNACDDCYQLFVDDVIYPGTGGDLEDGTELLLGPATLSGLQVVRKVWADSVAPTARYTELLRNNGAKDVTVDVSLRHDLGADDQALVDATSSGDGTGDAKDAWVTFTDTVKLGGSPIVGFWFGSADAVTVDLAADTQLVVDYTSVLVPAGQTVSIVHFAGIFDDPRTPVVDSVMDGVGSNGSMFDGMLFDHLLANINDVPVPDFSILGEAGAVAPFAGVSVQNLTTKELRQGSAASDGSFNLSIDGSSGDLAELRSTDGTLDKLLLP
ncbi:MAG: collagen-like protein [Myxococcales bacterium]|nr:collagen-like protein [Myxococcales bacterium]